MSLTLHLGVIEQFYVWGERGKSKKGKRRASTTGDVAEILENKYHVMETFFNVHEADIISILSETVEGAFENLVMGAPPNPNVYAAATDEIEALFNKFLDQKQMDGRVPGVPTQASLDGVSSRFKSGYGPKPRPSFIDTGLYESSFKSWVTNE